MDDILNRDIVNFAREDLASVRASSIEILLVQHWHEIAFYKDIPLNIVWSDYETVEALGMFRIYTARLDRKLIGYVCFRVCHHSHYGTSIQAVQDVLYLDPEHRNHRIGSQLIAFADHLLRAEGVQVVSHHSKVRFPLDEILKRQRYELMETVWGKRLDREP